MHSRYLLIPTLALIAGVGVAQAADDFQIHGFVSQGYLLTKNNALFTPDSEDSGTFEFNEFALNVVATPVERLRLGIQIAAQDLGNSFNDKPIIDWAYGNYSFGEVTKGVDLAVSAGRFKMGHGLYNDYRDLDMTRTAVFLPMSVYNPTWRDIMLAVNGIGANTNLSAGALGSFDVNAYVGNNNYSATEGPLYDIFKSLLGTPSSISAEMIRGGQVAWNAPVEGLRLKYSLLDAYKFKARGTYNLAPVPYVFDVPNFWDNIFSAEYQTGNLTLMAEYNYRYFDSNIFVNGNAVARTGNSLNATYLSAAYRFHPKWEALGGWQWSENTVTGTTPSNSKWYAWNAAIRYDVMDHWLIKAEYQWTHGTGLLRTADQADGTLEQTWGYFALKTTFDF